MSDLVQKFFKEDLTDAEEEALAVLLRNSEEAAELFAALAGKAYAAYGLPAPSWPGQPLPYRFTPPTWAWPLILVAGLGLSFSVISAINQEHLEEPEAKSIPVSPGVLTGPSAGEKTGDGLQDEAPAPRMETQPSGTKKRDGEPRPARAAKTKKRESETAIPLSALPSLDDLDRLQEGMGIPQTPGAGQIQPARGLRAVVEQAATGPMRVVIRDAFNAEVRVLFQGDLPAGRWTAEWDGLLSDGRAAPSGSYRIEATSGSKVQLQDFLLK